MQVLERLKTMIASDLIGLQENEEGIAMEHFDDKNIEIDFPDVDSMRRPTMLYIQPDYENLEPLGMHSDLATMRATVFLICKGAPNAILVKRVFALYSALYLLVRGDPTLCGFIEDARITDMDYYPTVTASSTITAIEASIDLQWSKEF
jgi:hypothetical protein